MNKPFTLGILGAGFCGKMLASKLIANSEFASNSKIYLIDPDFVNGVAYGTPDEAHLLNVRAANMAALSEKPAHLVEYLNEKFGDQDWSAKFVSRKLYGEYLESIFSASLVKNPNAIEQISDEVQSVKKNGAKLEVQLTNQVLTLDHLVLAYGNIHTGKIPTSNGPANAKAAWPINKEVLSQDRILLVGSSLTMIDLALSAARLNPNCRLIAVSRNGLLPQIHTPLDTGLITEIKALLTEKFANNQVQLLALLSYLRQLAKKYPWREVVDALRPSTVSFWRSLSSKDKRIFYRRLSTFWSIHRHRVAPEVNDQLQKLIADGRLKMIPGKILSAAKSDSEQDIVIQKRNGEKIALQVDAIINCTGPASIKQLSTLPMISSLLGERLIQADAFGVGLSMADSEDSEVLFTKWISSLGPPVRGELLECTAIPELRMLVERLSKLLQRHTGH